MIKIKRPNCPYPKALDKKNYKYKENKAALIDASFGKCMYCETRITAAAFGHVEHIKPQSRYPAEAYEWSNLGFCCDKCNNKKRANFNEQYLYIDPYSEDPELFLQFEGARLVPKDKNNQRAHLTIEDVGLNRSCLIEQRMEKIKELSDHIVIWRQYLPIDASLRKALEVTLHSYADPNKEYSLLLKYFVSQVLSELGYTEMNRVEA